MKFILLLFLVSCGCLQAEPNKIVINLAKQRLLLYQGDRILVSARISSGRKSMATPAGHFVIDLKTPNMPDPYYHMQLPYFMRLSVSPPFGIHYAHDPGYAASHGCIRIGSMLAATALYNLTPIGTGVTIQKDSALAAESWWG